MNLEDAYAKYGKEETKNLAYNYPQYNIGRGTYGWLKVREPNDYAALSVGAFCSFADGVEVFLGGNHRHDWVTTYPFSQCSEGRIAYARGHEMTKGNVVIGNDVWVGANVMILSGVTIGDGVVVGARSVIAKNLEPYGIYVGNPARLVRKRFDDSIIEKLLEIKWWDLDDKKIIKLLPFMLNTDIQAFINEATLLKG